MRRLGHLAIAAYGMIGLAVAALAICLATVELIGIGWSESHAETLMLLGVVAVIALVVGVTRD